VNGKTLSVRSRSHATLKKKALKENDNYRDKIEETLAFLKGRLPAVPKILVSMGTGQGNLPDGLEVHQEIPYSNIPNFPPATAPGHKGRLLQGRLAGQEVAILLGRVHYYEGYSLQEVTLPVRTLSLLGCKVLLAGNAAGGLNLEWAAGGLMIITDHLNFMGADPLRGPNNNDWGPRFPDMSQVYSLRLKDMALTCAKRLNLSDIKTGIYAAVAGPSLETAAETRFLRNCGADAVGMSTVPEVIVAKHAGMEIFGLSIIANINDPDNFQPIILEEVIAQVERAETNFLLLLNELIKSIGNE